MSPLRPVTSRTQSSTCGLSVVNVAISVPSPVIPKARRPGTAEAAEPEPGAPTMSAVAAEIMATVAANLFLVPVFTVVFLPFERTSFPRTAPQWNGSERAALQASWTSLNSEGMR